MDQQKNLEPSLWSLQKVPLRYLCHLTRTDRFNQDDESTRVWSTKMDPFDIWKIRGILSPLDMTYSLVEPVTEAIITHAKSVLEKAGAMGVAPAKCLVLPESTAADANVFVFQKVLRPPFEVTLSVFPSTILVV